MKLVSCKKFKNIERVALRKLLVLDASISITDLRTPPSNHLEALKCDRKGQHSIRINSQFRICFEFIDNDCYRVEIVDYH